MGHISPEAVFTSARKISSGWGAAAAVVVVFATLLLTRHPAWSTLAAERQQLRFRDVSHEAGLNAVVRCGGEEKRAVIEVNGSGLCWLDYNNDGWLDLYVVNGSTLEELREKGTSPHEGDGNHLYRNNGNRTFTDVTAKAAVSSNAWGTACAAADFDNDGWIDLFVSNVGECRLYRNLGNGTFSDVSKQAGVGGKFNWYTGATFGDYDGDGFLDLFVAGYLDPAQVLSEQKTCSWKGFPVYCGPPGMKGAPDVLYHNNGDGTFSDVTLKAGVTDKDLLFGFTASFEDFDNDGKPDLFVANDRGRNYLYHNKGGGTFEEIGELWGTAYPIEGIAQANMGVAIGDVDRNGFMDILVTTFSDEHFTLYKNAGHEVFLDASTEAHVAIPTTPFMGWGTFFADLDNDGFLDLFAVNGHVYPAAERAPGLKERYRQRPLLFRQSEKGTFEEVALNLPQIAASRGAAYADFDNDGDIDMAYTSLGTPPVRLRF